jgi:hypothetical protein
MLMPGSTEHFEDLSGSCGFAHAVAVNLDHVAWPWLMLLLAHGAILTPPPAGRHRRGYRSPMWFLTDSRTPQRMSCAAADFRAVT